MRIDFKMKKKSPKCDCKKIILAILALTILFLSCKLMLNGVGVGVSERKVFLLASIIIILNSSRKSFWYVALPMSLCYAIYSPIGLNFGAPSYQYVASVFVTNFLETKDFFSQISPTNYLYPFAITFGILLFRFITVNNDINLHKNKTILCVLVIFPMLQLAPFAFFIKAFNSFSEVNEEVVKLNNLMKKGQWYNSRLVNSKYDNYILIIGESARRDYHHAYGYPINNTPFMSSSNGILIDGLTSGGTNTVASLRLMLTVPNKKNWEPNYGLNFVDLAKSSGLKTYWISNQGFTGNSDTPIAAIARRSDYEYFLKYGSFYSKNTSDFELLDKVNEIVNKKTKKKKLIVIHLYGSHVNACERLSDYHKIVNVKNKKFSYLNCYISTIQKTDDFLKNTYRAMTESFHKSGITSSLVYFSDHGLSHYESDGVLYMVHQEKSIYHYNIPLFRVDIDSVNRVSCHSFKSGLNFTNGIANWIGIINKELSPDYDLFNCISDQDDYGLKKIMSNEAVIDPAIDITK